jgi:hypothetical protein
MDMRCAVVLQMYTTRLHTGVVCRRCPDVLRMPGDIFDWCAVVNRRIISAYVTYVAETFATLLRPTASKQAGARRAM